MAEHTYACPSCGQHISCDDTLLGCTVTCPSCRMVMQLPARPSIEDSSSFGAPEATSGGLGFNSPARDARFARTPARSRSRDDDGLPPPLPRSVWDTEVKIPWRRLLGLLGAVVVTSAGPPVFKALMAERHAAHAEEARRARFAPPPPLTTAQAAALEAFGRTLADACGREGVGALTDHLDPEAVGYRALRNIGLREPMMTICLEAMAGVSPKDFAPLSPQSAVVCAKVRCRTVDGFPSVLLRLHPQGKGCLHLEALVRPEGGGFKLVDLHVLNLDLFMSDLLRALTVPMVNGLPVGMAARAFGCKGEPRELEDFAVRTLVKAYHDGSALPLRLHLRYSPTAVQESRMSLVLQLMKPTRTSLPAGLRDRDDLDSGELLGKLLVRPVQRLAFSGLGEPGRGTDLTLADLREADAELGGDPYVKCLIAAKELDTGAPSKAGRLLQQAVSEDPSLLDMSAGLRIRVAAKLRDFQAMRDELERLSRSAPDQLEAALTGVETGAFLESPEGRDWSERLTPAAPALR